MPEDLLDLLEARPPHHQVARRRVAEVMEAEALDAGPGERRLEGRPDLTPGPVIADGEQPAVPALGGRRRIMRSACAIVEGPLPDARAR